MLDPLPLIDREFTQELKDNHNLVLDHATKLISSFGYIPSSAGLLTATTLLIV